MDPRHRPFGELGCLRIKFQGGEPTLRRDPPVLCEAARRAEIVAAVVTNGQRIAVGECVEDSTTDPQHPAGDEPLASPRGTP